jgi:hypothetical protein
MATPTHLDSAYNVGDAGFIFKQGDYSAAAITKVGFREGFNPLDFNADNDFEYETNVFSVDGETYISVPQKLFFPTKEAMTAYIIPPDPEP